MASSRLIAILFLLALAAACATTRADPYWRNTGATRADFTLDNQSCGARATRMKPTPRADQLAGGATVPNNRIDRPPQRWASAVAENAYMDCMAERGWRPLQR